MPLGGFFQGPHISFLAKYKKLEVHKNKYKKANYTWKNKELKKLIWGKLYLNIFVVQPISGKTRYKLKK